ncbi:MAG: PilT/PilU family type 4a pilus ATPase [Clostridiales bacterium]
MESLEILKKAVENKASDIFIIAGKPFAYKINNKIVDFGGEIMLPMSCNKIISQIYELAENRDMEKYIADGDDDFAFSVPGLSRFRVSVYRQRSSLAAVIRVINVELPNPQDIHIPQSVIDLGELKKGLVLITGSAGSGKSTTLSCIIDKINNSRSCHIITLEDPLEFLHKHKKSIVSQREVPMDTKSYVAALRASLRQSPDVILLGEMRDYETINIAMTAAETGHLVLSTLHTVGAANSIDRIVDVFPENQQAQVRVQLAMVLKAVVSQQLIPGTDGKPVPAFEIMLCNNAVHNMIREAKTHQIDTVISSSAQEGMTTMNASLAKLIQDGKVTLSDGLLFSSNPEMLKKILKK